MEINNRKIKAIRPMTDKELEEYTRNRYIILNDKPIFCIEFEDGTILLPKELCINCMQLDKCLFTLANRLP